MPPFRILLIFICIILYVPGIAQKIATLEVELTAPTHGLYVPAQLKLDGITFLSDTVLNLVEIQGNKRIPVSFQIENTGSRVLHWMVNSENDKSRRRIYELVKGTPAIPGDLIEGTVGNGSLTIHSGDRNFLRYNFKTVYPPQGIDTAFKRSGFIHPLWTPTGKILTRIQPPDHYHHYGIWNPWTHVLFEGDTVDFWNIKGQKGTVRFDNFISVTSGAVFAEYQALHEHVAFKNGQEKVALNELQTVRVYRPENGQNNYNVDITIQLNCASTSPFLILEYRYAGLGWRAT